MKTLTYINIVILTTSLLLVNRVEAQENQMELTLAETVDLALQNNWQVRRSEEYLGMASGELKEANQAFLPKVQLSETFATTNDPLTAFGYKLKQSSISAEDFDPGYLNDPNRITNYNTRVEVQQPLINVDGIMARKAANVSRQASEENLDWTRSLTVLQAKRLYFNFQLASEQLKVVAHSLKTAKASHAVARDLADQGLIHQADLMNAELRVTEIESHLLSVENEIIRANGDLVYFLNLPSETQVGAIDPIGVSDVPLDLLSATEIPESRSDLKALSLQLEASDHQLKSSKSSFLPKLNAFGSYEWNDSSPFGTQANNYLVGGKLQWDIFQGGSRMGKMQKAAAQRNIAELSYQEKIAAGHQQLTQVQNGIRLASKQIDVSEQALAQAEESYNVRRDRYEEGLEKTSDLLMAESMLMEKKLNKIRSLNQYQQLVFNLEMLLEKEIITQ